MKILLRLAVILFINLLGAIVFAGGLLVYYFVFYEPAPCGAACGLLEISYLIFLFFITCIMTFALWGLEGGFLMIWRAYRTKQHFSMIAGLAVVSAICLTPFLTFSFAFVNTLQLPLAILSYILLYSGLCSPFIAQLSNSD